ncbi:hypothetical protein ACFXD5_05890 [Streptomyces sp. NPDC059385]|uniref:hypothetical protein n=1 Tax=Streptomyces sp. NPDC059385 TaxID=3346817 RepID=UPI0036A7CF16
MSIELDFPEFPYEDPPGRITWRQKPWNGVLVRVDRQSFKTGDKVTFDVVVRSDATGQTPAATIQGVVSISSDCASVDYTIPWTGVLDAVTEGSIIAWYTLTPANGGEPISSEAAIVDYSRLQPGGTVCGPDH